VDLFVAMVDAAKAGGLYGLPEEGEDIKVHALDAGEALSWLQEGRIRTAAAIIAMQWFALHRSRIRDSWTASPSKA
jgi:ADP-ribose pyrophosphatase